VVCWFAALFYLPRLYVSYRPNLVIQTKPHYSLGYNDDLTIDEIVLEIVDVAFAEDFRIFRPQMDF